MKHLFVKWLSALLIAALLLTPVAMMEESGEAPTVILEESTPDVNEEKNCEAEDGAPVNADEGDVDSEDAEETVESDAAIVVEAVDESVAEAGDVELTMLEAQGDGLYIDALEDSAAETADASAMLLGAGGDVDINSSFPDSAFREYVRGFDTSKDGKLSTYERSVVTEIRVVDKGIKDLTGIKLFPNLTSLSCCNNPLTTLDVNGCSNLTLLYCDDNHLSTLDVRGCSNLTDLNCQANFLSTLDVSGCPNLTMLRCDFNQLIALNVSACWNLTDLSCQENKLSTLDVSGCSNMTELDCSFNQLIALNVSGCSNLTRLACAWNQLTTLNVSDCSKLTILYCNDNDQLTALNVSGCSKVTQLSCSNNKITMLDVSGCPNLTMLRCGKNAISELNLKNNTKLEYLNCYMNPRLKTLDISNCEVLINDVDPNAPEEVDIDEDGQPDSVGYGLYLGWYRLVCDKGVTVITKKAEAPAPAPAPAPTPAPVINAIKKNNKTTITAAPGTVCQLNLGGASGKKFKSSKKKVATVDKSGNVTIKGAGKTVISFKVGKKTRKVKLTVKDPTIPIYVTLSMSGTNTVKKGESLTLTATLPEGTNSGIKWKSSNKKVATVKNGVVKFKKKGKVTITATAKRGKKKAKVKFKVTQ